MCQGHLLLELYLFVFILAYVALNVISRIGSISYFDQVVQATLQNNYLKPILKTQK